MQKCKLLQSFVCHNEIVAKKDFGKSSFMLTKISHIGGGKQEKMQIITDFCEPKLNFIVQKNVKKVTGVHILLKISGNYLLYNIFTFVGKHTIKSPTKKCKLL